MIKIFAISDWNKESSPKIMPVYLLFMVIILNISSNISFKWNLLSWGFFSKVTFDFGWMGIEEIIWEERESDLNLPKILKKTKKMELL